MFTLGVENSDVKAALDGPYREDIEELFREITGSPVRLRTQLDGEGGAHTDRLLTRSSSLQSTPARNPAVGDLFPEDLGTYVPNASHDDLRTADVDFLTLGQYLQPTKKHASVVRYVEPREFDAYAEDARARGFLLVSASPLTRSSYHAGEDFARLRAARERRLSAG